MGWEKATWKERLIVIPILSPGKSVHLVSEINFHTSKKTDTLLHGEEDIISTVCSNSEATCFLLINK